MSERLRAKVFVARARALRSTMRACSVSGGAQDKFGRGRTCFFFDAWMTPEMTSDALLTMGVTMKET